MDGKTFTFVADASHSHTVVVALVSAAACWCWWSTSGGLPALTFVASWLSINLAWAGFQRSRPLPKESLTIVPSLGLRLSSSRSPASSDVFLPSNVLSHVVLNEALQGFRVRTYLCVVRKGGEGSGAGQVIVLFPNCRRLGFRELAPIEAHIQRLLTLECD